MSLSRECRICHNPKPLGEFYAHPSAKQGRDTKCKDCAKAYQKLRQREDPDRMREISRRTKKKNFLKQQDLKRRYAKSHKEQIRATQLAWIARNKEKRRAHSIVNNALRNGTIQKMPCKVCGDTSSHAHHDDYSKPLYIDWLCPLHHGERHQQLRDAQRALGNRS